MVTPQLDRHVEVPKNKVAFLEYDGRALDTGSNLGIILEDKLKIGLRTSLDKIDGYSYKAMLSIFQNKAGPIYFSSEYIWK
jgi:hypothetical protein